MKTRDQIGREIQIKDIPKRIICLVPSLTELLFDLGLENSIVGLTKFCVHPKHARKSKKVVGGTKQIKVDKIKALKPDIILCNKEENSVDIVKLCSAIAPTHVSDIYNLDDTIELIEQYGKIFDCIEEAKRINHKLHKEKKLFISEIKSIKRLNVAYFIWRDPLMVAAKNTFIDYMLELAGFCNAFADRGRYPEVTWKEVQAKSPELIFLSSEPYPFKEQHQIEFNEKTQDTKIITVNGEMFSWYGTRLLKAFDYFRSLHKSIKALPV